MTSTLWRALARAEWRAHPVRQALAMLAIAIGVALGLAVQLINVSAVESFEAATRSSTGTADLELRARGLDTARGFDDRLLDAVYSLDGVADASPVVVFDAVAATAASTSPQTVEVLGLDPFRVAKVTPSLVGRSSSATSGTAVGARGAWLSTGALAALGLSEGQSLTLRLGSRSHEFVVAGTLEVAAGRRVAAIDIATAQDAFGFDGRLSRIDIKLGPGWTPERFRSAFTPPANTALDSPHGESLATTDPSRAYRVNLGVLALIALLTGAFLVYSVLSLSIAGRRAQFALLRALGATRREVVRQVLLEAVLLGTAGAAIGVFAGAGLATAVLHLLGADLGGGYFAGSSTALAWSTPQALGYFLLGVGAALAGSVGPAREIANLPTVQALKAGTDVIASSATRSPWWAVIAWLVAASFAAMPPVLELPLFGYAAVALLLLGGIAGIPWLASSVGRLTRRAASRSRSAVLVLAASHVERAPGQAQVLLAGVVASFSLMVAMGIMVSSFRASLTDWLDTVLPADLYVRAEPGASGLIDDDLQGRIARLPGITRIEWARMLPIVLDASRPPVQLMARPLKGGSVALPTLAPPLPVEGVAVHVSEAIVDLYGVKPGQRLVLPGSPSIDATVASVWRDYANQFGSVVIDLDDYRRLTGDRGVTAARLWLDRSTSPASVIDAMTALGVRSVTSAVELRRRSLQIFDRSFAITYALEAVAIVIGLAGIAATVATQALARAREFGMLRHLGLRRRDVLAIVMTEVALLTIIASLAGLGLGVAISHVLVDVVNPQSFHWTMDFHLPVPLLVGVSAVLLASAIVTAAIAGRRAAAGSAIAAVREDW